MPTSPRARALIEDASLLKALECEEQGSFSQRIIASREQRAMGTSYKVRSTSEKELNGALTERGSERSPASNSTRSGSQTARSGARTPRSLVFSHRFPRPKRPELGRVDVEADGLAEWNRHGTEGSSRYTTASVVYDVLKELESSLKQLFQVRFGRTGGWEGC